MGLNESKPEKLSKEERQSREVAKANMVQQRKQDINQIQQQAISSISRISNNSILGGGSGNNSIVESKQPDVKDIYTFLHVTEKAKTQLEREGASLVKADLIAILVALEPTLKSSMGKMDEMRVTDLNAMIRSIIYDPKRIMDMREPIGDNMKSSNVSNVSNKNLLQ